MTRTTTREMAEAGTVPFSHERIPAPPPVGVRRTDGNLGKGTPSGRENMVMGQPYYRFHAKADPFFGKPEKPLHGQRELALIGA